MTEADAILRGPVSVSLDLMQADDMVAVTGVLEGTVVRECVRCLKEYEDALAFSVHAAFDREGKESKVGARQSETGRASQGTAEQRQKRKQMPSQKTKGMTAISIRATTSNSRPMLTRAHYFRVADAAALPGQLRRAVCAMWEGFERRALPVSH